MGILSEADSIPANETLTVTFGGLLGPFTGASSVEEGIQNSFADTNWIVEGVTVPFLSEIEPPVMFGHFRDSDGAGHSYFLGRNLSLLEAENVWLYGLEKVPGLYEAHFVKAETGMVSPSLISGVNLTNIFWVVALVAGLIAAAVIISKVA